MSAWRFPLPLSDDEAHSPLDIEARGARQHGSSSEFKPGRDQPSPAERNSSKNSDNDIDSTTNLSDLQFHLSLDSEAHFSDDICLSQNQLQSRKKTMSDSSGAGESWISSFCSLLGHEYFAEVSEEFIEDDFNLTGLQSQVPMYKEALEVCFICAHSNSCLHVYR